MAAGSPGAWDGTPGTPEEERYAGSVNYLDVLARLQRELAPRHYLEIGVRHGASLALAQGRATGVDPAPALRVALPAAATIVEKTSDAFFAEDAASVSPDFAFIDGMHLAEYALRDFINIEERAAPGAVVAIDDILPNHPAQAARARRTSAWTGDVWRLAAILTRWRPDLFLLSLDTSPTGLLLVAGLDPRSRVLRAAYDAIVAEALDWAGPPASVLARTEAVSPAGAELDRVIAALRESRARVLGPGETAAQARRALAGPAKTGEPRPFARLLSLIGFRSTGAGPR